MRAPHGMWGKGVAAFLAERGAKYRRARASAVSHRTEAKMDPRTQLAGSPLERRQAWTVFPAAASRQNGAPVQYQRQRQLLQLQQDIRSSWRWFLHRSHGLTGTVWNGSRVLFAPSPGTPACAPPGRHPRQSGRVRRNRPWLLRAASSSTRPVFARRPGQLAQQGVIEHRRSPRAEADAAHAKAKSELLQIRIEEKQRCAVTCTKPWSTRWLALCWRSWAAGLHASPVQTLPCGEGRKPCCANCAPRLPKPAPSWRTNRVSRTNRTEHRRDRCGRCRQSRSRSSTLKAGSASVLLTSGCQGALSCATRQGGLLLDGADGDPDVVRHQGGGQDSDGGNQASDGLVGHDITLGCPLGWTTTGRAYRGTVN